MSAVSRKLEFVYGLDIGRLYLSDLKSLGAAQAVTQCCRWKTGYCISMIAQMFENRSAASLTFFDAVFFWSLVLRVLVLGSHSLHALLVVVLIARAGCRPGAFCRDDSVS